MNKTAFLAALRSRLSDLPEEDIKTSLDYYNEIINDYMEEGLNEEEAVRSLGDLEEIAAQILTETSYPNRLQKKIKQKRTLKAWEIVLLALGSPIWLSLLIAVLCIILAVYIVLWAVVLVLYAVVFSFAAGALAGIAGFFAALPARNLPQGTLFLGGGLFCGGITVLLFFGFNRITKGILGLSKKVLFSVKTCLSRKEEAQ